MKTFLIITLTTFIFSGCSKYNAFSNFNLTQAQEKSEDSIQSATINTKEGSVGLLSAIYLNRVYPQKYKDGEYFYVYLYTQIDKKKLDFFLNNNLCVELKELSVQNEFSHLVPSSEKWKKYYLVKFKKEGEHLALQAKNSYISSAMILFKKNDK